MRRWGCALLLALAAVRAPAAIVLDGKLDEPEWQQAQRLADFKTTEPNTQAAPRLATVALVHSDENGLYVGFICDQPPAVERARTQGQRDQYIAGDRVNAVIDFDGNGTSAYEFTAHLGGGKVDGAISRQLVYNYDWDADWDYAVSETADQWFVEYRIPWNVAPMGPVRDGKQDVGVFFSRFVVALGQRYSVPGNTFNRPTFVSDMHKLRIAGFARAQLDVIPYAAATRDVLREDTDARTGVDVFWKPNGQHQLTATINPDFGQVETDQLVVNFSAIPTFFPDKRPFFTENLDLFSTEYTVLYTRRIGAAPDAGPEGATDIESALKYTGRSGGLSYGAIAAWEDDTSLAEGRDFYVGRARYKLSDALTLGWIGTHVERPTLERQADTQGVDFAWTVAPGTSLNGMAVVSEVDHAAPTIFDPAGDGVGARVTFRYAPGTSFENITALVSRNATFNLRDAGFQTRTNQHLLQQVMAWYWRDWAPESPIQEQSLYTNALAQVNDSGDRLPASFVGTWGVTRRDTSFGGLEYDATTLGGADDLITRGNGLARLPARHWLFPYYGSRQTGLFRYLIVGGYGTGYFTDGDYRYVRVEPGLYPSDRFSLVSRAGLLQSPDEILWLGGNLLGAFDYEQVEVSLDLNWFPRARHELRGKFQWVAASGDPVAALRPGPEGHLVATSDPVGAFSITDTAFQVRYRYEFAPLSELFVVYSHGGFDALAEPERGLGSSLRRGLAEETASQFLVKVRYRFAIL
jgi:hypothetical protein